jgi:hypothetical protein
VAAFYNLPKLFDALLKTELRSEVSIAQHHNSLGVNGVNADKPVLTGQVNESVPKFDT